MTDTESFFDDEDLSDIETFTDGEEGPFLSDIEEGPVPEIGDMGPPSSARKFRSIDSLRSTTATIQVYTNLSFDLEQVYSTMPIHELSESDYIRSKFTNNILSNVYESDHQLGRVIRETIRSPRGTVFCIQIQTKDPVDGKKKVIYRGVDIRKKMKKKDERGFVRGEVKSFINQVMFDVSIDNHRPIKEMTDAEIKKNKKNFSVRNINVMLFKTNFKIAGCKDFEEAKEVCRIFWEGIRHNEKCYAFIARAAEGEETKAIVNRERENVVSFTLEINMKNYGFNIFQDFGEIVQIDKKKLNNVFNEDQYKALGVKMSVLADSVQPAVNVTTYSDRYKKIMYHVMLYDIEKNEYFVEDRHVNQYKKPKYIKEHKECQNTVIIFGTGEVILTGRHFEELKEAYNLVHTICHSRVEDIREKLDPETPSISFVQFAEEILEMRQ